MPECLLCFHDIVFDEVAKTYFHGKYRELVRLVCGVDGCKCDTPVKEKKEVDKND